LLYVKSTLLDQAMLNDYHLQYETLEERSCNRRWNDRVRRGWRGEPEEAEPACFVADGIDATSAGSQHGRELDSSVSSAYQRVLCRRKRCYDD
jgi:hypothetical protein